MNCTQMASADRPQYAQETLIIVLDVSTSMNSDDWIPTRLDGAKDAAISLLEEKFCTYPLDKVGIVSFSDNAAIRQLPLPARTGRNKLRKVIRRLRAKGNTNIRAGLTQAGRALLLAASGKGILFGLLGSWFGRDAMLSNVISGEPTASAEHVILLSDGDENRGGNPRIIAGRLKNRGVVISCIGIGASFIDVNEGLLSDIASTNPDGTSRYWVIDDQYELAQKFQELATGLRSVQA